ncbi:hypothetical protein D3C80_2058870 [compost metagenome]
MDNYIQPLITRIENPYADLQAEWNAVYEENQGLPEEEIQQIIQDKQLNTRMLKLVYEMLGHSEEDIRRMLGNESQ